MCPASSQKVPFSQLTTADLMVDAVYKGGDYGDVRDDPISRLLGVGNMGGFRFLGSSYNGDVTFCVLYSELTDPDWPDKLYPESGRFVYFGDNKEPGRALHDTRRGGNRILRRAFNDLHSGSRSQIPPFFIFTKAGSGRDVVFRGLGVPGAPTLPQTDDLVAIWKTANGRRFQNYRSIFTILDVAEISRQWIEALKSDHDHYQSAPEVWRRWVNGGPYVSLTAPKSVIHRTPSEQLPAGPPDTTVVNTLVDYYKSVDDGHFKFESCAANILQMMDDNYEQVDLTRPWRDGGRDAVGNYRIGTSQSALHVDFALEVKCKAPSARNSSGVRQTSRLISRLRHRQFGVFLTTSCISRQAYKEIVEDDHPILVITGADIAEILLNAGLTTEDKVRKWLHNIE